jgi:arginase
VAAVAGRRYRERSLLASEFPFDIARRGYSVGTKVLQAVLHEHDGPTAMVPAELGDIGLEERDGIEAKEVVLQQLRRALAIISEHESARSRRLAASAR